MPNQLAQETSPYLRQHAHQPVDWHPWGPAALALAREQDKPILLSIGYAACHWCHVMAHESFDNPDIAALMNRRFINIKVDREERPDLDHIYQTAHQLLTRRPGGWPLTLFLTPDGDAFFACLTASMLPAAERWVRWSGDDVYRARAISLVTMISSARAGDASRPERTEASPSWT